MSTWNPSDKNASISLSSGDKTATQTSSSFNAVRSVDSHSSGKYYFEVVVSTLDMFVGIMSSTGSLNSYIGSDNQGIGVWTFNDTYYNNGGTAGTANASIGSATVIGVLVDRDAGNLQFTYDGALGVGPPTFTLPSGAIFAAAGGSNASGGVANGRFTAGELLYLPSGYTAWSTGGGGGGSTVPIKLQLMTGV